MKRNAYLCTRSNGVCRSIAGAVLELAVACAILATPDLAVSAAPTPAAVTTAPTPMLAVDSPLCAASAIRDPASMARGVTRGAIVGAPTLLPTSAETKFTYVQSGVQALAPVDFHVFLSKAGEAAKPLEIVNVVHPVDLSTDAKTAGATSENAYALTVDLEEEPGFLPIDDYSLVVIPCSLRASDGKGASSPLGFAQTSVRISDRAAAIVISLIVMLAVYLLAARLKYLSSAAAIVSAASMRSSPQTFAQAKTDVSSLRVSDPVTMNWRDYLDPVVLSADIFNRASLSQLQILFFLMLVGYGVTYSLLRTGTLSELSSSVVYLLGIPALGALGNQATNAGRDRFSADNWAWLVSQKVLAINDPGTGKPGWQYVLTTGSNLDLYKLQAFTFSIIVGGAMIYSGFTHLETFNVPVTLLQIMGLSQVVFVGGRLTQPANVADADAQVAELRKRAADLRVAATSGIDVDSAGKPLRTAEATTPPNVVQTIADARLIAPNAVARYLETADELEILLKGLTYRDVVTDGLRDPFKTSGLSMMIKKPRPGPPPNAPGGKFIPVPKIFS